VDKSLEVFDAEEEDETGEAGEEEKGTGEVPSPSVLFGVLRLEATVGV
jgi:hypothetical protein